LLQWLVVDGFQPFNLKLLFRRTRQTSSDKSATASNAGRYQQLFMRKLLFIFCLGFIQISFGQTDTDTIKYSLPEFTRWTFLKGDTIRRTYCYNKNKDLIWVDIERSMQNVDSCECVLELSKDNVVYSQHDTTASITSDYSLIRKLAYYKHLKDGDWLVSTYENNTIISQGKYFENNKIILFTDTVVATVPTPPYNEETHIINYYRLIKK
jgi:hypothetical protein